MFGYIYKTTNLLNNKIYIGKKHKNYFVPDYFGSGILIKKAIKKYGKENFKVEVIDWCDSLEELNMKEKYYIETLNSDRHTGLGYNIAKGGDGGDLFNTLTIKEKINFIESCRKRSLGENNPNYGNGDKIRGNKNPSKRLEVRKRLSETSSGKNNGMYGVTGKNHPMYGKHMSEESKEKMRETRRNKKPIKKECIFCGSVFEAMVPQKKYCNKTCKSKYFSRKYRDNKEN